MKPFQSAEQLRPAARVGPVSTPTVGSCPTTPRVTASSQTNIPLFFSGAVTSSPIRRRLRSNHNCHSLDRSVLSPDSSYICSSPTDKGGIYSYRRSPRLLTNGYYAVTEDNFSWDQDGNVSLTPCEPNVSYKENLVRIFRRRRGRRTLRQLLSDVTETCHSWLDFRGVFRTGRPQDQDQYPEGDVDRRARPGSPPLDESLWPRPDGAGPDVCPNFTYDPTEAPPPPDKGAPPLTFLGEICSEVCGTREQFTQTVVGGLTEVPLHAGPCRCHAAPAPTGLMTKVLLLLFATGCILAALFSSPASPGSLNRYRYVWWRVAAASAVLVTTAAAFTLTRSAPASGRRRAKTEDITSRNE